MFRVLIIPIILLVSTSVYSNEAIDLKEQILSLDNKLFTAFNHGDIKTLKTMMHPELEFYHDKAGFTNYRQTMQGFSQLFNRSNRPHRRIIEGKTEIYPVPNFGAIQVGQHEFCNTENNVKHCGVFKFNHVWKKTNEQWKLKRILSFDH